MKLLGVILDHKLTWEKHIHKVKSTVCRITANLARTTSVIPLKSRRTLYDALVLPHFSYCDVVWDGTYAKHADNLQKAANFGAKSLLGLKKNSSANAALVKLKMMPQEDRRRLHLGVLAHKLKEGKSSKELVTTFKNRTTRYHQHNTRSAARGDATSQQHNTARNERSTMYRALKFWNGIPVTLRRMEDTSKFKKALQKQLLQDFISKRRHVRPPAHSF